MQCSLRLCMQYMVLDKEGGSNEIWRSSGMVCPGGSPCAGDEEILLAQPVMHARCSTKAWTIWRSGGMLHPGGSPCA